MTHASIISFCFYYLLMATAVAIGVLIFTNLDTLTYQIVTIFITLIFVSNCLAKMCIVILKR